jgi:hypothetical protein
MTKGEYMENNKNYRTLYMIQVLTIVVLILVLIAQILPFFGLSVNGGNKMQYFTNPGAGGSISPSNHLANIVSPAALAQNSRIHIPPIILK